MDEGCIMGKKNIIKPKRKKNNKKNQLKNDFRPFPSLKNNFLELI